jgi:hypothetical protein
MAPEAVTDQDAWSLVSPFSGFRIEYTLELLEANLRVCIPRVGVCILPSRGRERGPVASMGTRWPDDHRV